MNFNKNNFFAVILTVFAVVVFSSCSSEDDYGWMRGALNFSTESDKNPIYTDVGDDSVFHMICAPKISEA